MKNIPRTRCSGRWTEGQFRTFVRSQLRGATWKWAPISEILKEARITKGVYQCNGCKEFVFSSVKQGNKRVKNVFVDHVNPVVDPVDGFISWDVFINNLFCEKENLQLLCGMCHDKKTLEEKKLSTLTRRQKKEKELNE